MQAHERKALSQAWLEHAVEVAGSIPLISTIEALKTIGLTVIRK